MSKVSYQELNKMFRRRGEFCQMLTEQRDQLLGLVQLIETTTRNGDLARICQKHLKRVAELQQKYDDR